MPHTNAVFRDVLKLLPWSSFERLVEKHGTDKLVRSSTAKRQLTALLFGQKNTPLNSARSMPVEPGTGVVSDRIGFLPGRQAKSRKNPMQDAVREIVVTMATGGTLRLFSNDLDAPAKEIADLYKRRWQIELFFRVMKQTLKITHFIGRSENAAPIQIAVALIAFLLLSLLRKMAQDQQSLLETARLVRANLMYRRDFTRLKKPQKPPPFDSQQLSLNWSPT